MSTFIDPTWAFGIDTSQYNGDVDIARFVKDDGISFVIAKMSDGYRTLAGGSDEDAGNYIDPQFYKTVQKCYDAGIPCIGYHFFRYGNECMPSFDPESPSSDPQWGTVKTALGYPNALRAVQGISIDLESYKDPDGNDAAKATGNYNISERAKQMYDWFKHFCAPAPKYPTTTLLYSSPGFLASYAPNLRTPIDGGGATSGWNLWLATWPTGYSGKALAHGSVFAQVNVPYSVAWPIFGNWGEHVKIWQYAVNKVDGHDIDLDVFKGTKEQLYAWLGYTPHTVTPPPATTYTITGAVTPALAGATISLGALTTTTGMQGQFTLAAVPAGTTGSLTPALAGYKFNPVTIPVNVNGNLAAANFAATTDNGQLPADPDQLDRIEAKVDALTLRVN